MGYKDPSGLKPEKEKSEKGNKVQTWYIPDEDPFGFMVEHALLSAEFVQEMESESVAFDAMWDAFDKRMSSGGGSTAEQMGSHAGDRVGSDGGEGESRLGSSSGSGSNGTTSETKAAKEAWEKVPQSIKDEIADKISIYVQAINKEITKGTSGQIWEEGFDIFVNKDASGNDNYTLIWYVGEKITFADAMAQGFVGIKYDYQHMDQESKDKYNKSGLDVDAFNSFQGHTHIGPTYDREENRIGWGLGYANSTIQGNPNRFLQFGGRVPSDTDVKQSANREYNIIIYYDRVSRNMTFNFFKNTFDYFYNYTQKVRK